jgi:hypothetical protein
VNPVGTAIAGIEKIKNSGLTDISSRELISLELVL